VQETKHERPQDLSSLRSAIVEEALSHSADFLKGFEMETQLPEFAGRNMGRGLSVSKDLTAFVHDP
jgi:hypothetical protein